MPLIFQEPWLNDKKISVNETKLTSVPTLKIYIVFCLFLIFPQFCNTYECYNFLGQAEKTKQLLN